MKTYKTSTHQVKYSHYQSIKNGETAYLQLLRILIYTLEMVYLYRLTKINIIFLRILEATS